MPQVTIVVGNPKVGSRTREVAEGLARQLIEPGSTEVRMIELAEYSAELFDWESERVKEAVAAVGSSDLVIFASPTFKAGYTGLLKAFLDRFSANGLAGIVAIPVHTGATSGHSMAANHILGPLLTELGALVPGRGLYVSIAELENADQLTRSAADQYRRNLERASTLVAVHPASSFV